MAKRWFGPRPIFDPAVYRHGSCGCCGCGGLDADEELVKYAAYRNGLRLKLTIEDVPDSFSMYLDGTYPIYLTEASGMSQYNGTWYLDVIRSQYGCIFNAVDNETFNVDYIATDPDFYPAGVPYTQTVRIRPLVQRASATFLNLVLGAIEHYSPDYEADAAPLIAGYVHPMIGLAFEPTDPAYLSGGGLFGEPGIWVEGRNAGWRPDQLTGVITGNLRFYLSDALINQAPLFPDLTDSRWVGTDVFWDFGASEFKIAGTFSLEIERL